MKGAFMSTKRIAITKVIEYNAFTYYFAMYIMLCIIYRLGFIYYFEFYITFKITNFCILDYILFLILYFREEKAQKEGKKIMKKHEIPANFYQESLFLFENRRLITRLDEINVSINEVTHIFKMQEYAGDSAILKFAFQPKDGLVRINEKKGNVEETNVLFSFIACKNDLRKYIKFFNENGFLFPLSMGEFNEANSLEILELSKRLSLCS